MPSGSFKQVDVRCPFYITDDGKQRITCEGIVEDSNLILAYRLRKDWEKQTLEYCCDGYTKCEIYRMLLEKYEDV